jgi:hypothetical protein
LNNTLIYWSVDKTGNIEQHKTNSGIKLDKTPPTITINSPISGGQVESSTVKMIWTGSDSTSGIKGYEVRLDGGSWITVGTVVSYEFTGLKDGTHAVDVRATDNAGNTKLASVSFTVNTMPWLMPVLAVGGLIAIVVIVVFIRRRGQK